MVPPITCEISEPSHGERGHCVPLMRNVLAVLLKDFIWTGIWWNLEKCRGEIFYFFFWGGVNEKLQTFRGSLTEHRH